MPGPAPLHPALPPQVRGQAQEALRAALYASSLVFTEVVMALAGPPRSHENELLLEGYFHCENLGGDWPPAGLTHIFTGLQEECLAGDSSVGPGASPPPDRDGRDFIAFSLRLDYQPDFEVGAQAGSLAEARANRLEGVDVAIIDRRLPDGDGLELIGELREASSGAKVLMMSAVMEPVQPREAQKVGVEGVVDKIASPEEIAAQIRAVRAV